MHFFLLLTLCVYCKNYFSYAEDWSGFDPTDYILDENSDLLTTATADGNDLWDLSSTTSIDSNNDLLLVDLPACASLTSSLGRRDGGICTNEKPDEDTDKKSSFEVRPLGRTKDAPLFPIDSNYELCLPDLTGYKRNMVFCDSGFAADRHPTLKTGIFDIVNCTPCTV